MWSVHISGITVFFNRSICAFPAGCHTEHLLAGERQPQAWPGRVGTLGSLHEKALPVPSFIPLAGRHEDQAKLPAQDTVEDTFVRSPGGPRLGPAGDSYTPSPSSATLLASERQIQ